LTEGWRRLVSNRDRPGSHTADTGGRKVAVKPIAIGESGKPAVRESRGFRQGRFQAAACEDAEGLAEFLI